MRTTKGNGGGSRGITRGVLIIPVLAAFIAVDIILIALALGWGREQPGSAEGHSQTMPAATVLDDQDSGEDEVASASSLDEEQSSLHTVPRLLSASSETVAWRTEGGTCDERGFLELTIDGGETWGATYPGSDRLGRTLWISGADYTAVQSVVASVAGCEPEGLRTFDSGSSWIDDEQVVMNSVIVDPNDASQVIWADKRLQGPCPDMTQVAVTGGVASVVCRDGSLWRITSDSGRWAQTGLENVVAVSGSEGRWIAAVDSSDCDGLRLVRFDGESLESLVCAPVGAGDAIALDLAGETLWLWAENEVLVSADFGRSFN